MSESADVTLLEHEQEARKLAREARATAADRALGRDLVARARWLGRASLYERRADDIRAAVDALVKIAGGRRGADCQAIASKALEEMGIDPSHRDLS